MATGHVTAEGLPYAPVEIAGRTFDALIDTGFEGGMQLPDAVRVWLDPPAYREVLFELGMGVTRPALSYWVDVIIDGLAMRVETFFAEADQVLLGIDVLRAFRVEIDYPAGTVRLEKPGP